MRRILFVDDEPNILDGLRRMLRGMRHEWTMHFEQSGQAGLRSMQERPFDVVISDMKMPGMDGAEFLTKVKESYPSTIRIILSGQSEKTAIMKSVGPTHRFLAKPCDADVLKATIEKSYSLRELLKSETLARLAAQLESIPSLPTLYQEIVRELQSPRASLEDIGRIIRKDIGMSAKVLKLVNSAYFGLLRPVRSVERAVTFLGLDTISALVLGAQVFAEFEGVTLPGFSLEALWSHSTDTAAFARAIAKQDGRDEMLVADVFMAGMLHDSGKLVLAGNLVEQLGQVLGRVERGEPPEQAERAVFGATHAEIGAYLMGIWGLPDTIVEAIAYHAEPARAPASEIGGATYVHVADHLTRELRGTAPGAMDLEYLRDVGAEERLDGWRETCMEILNREDPS